MALQGLRGASESGPGNQTGNGGAGPPTHRWLHPLAGRDQDIAELRHKLRSADLRLDDYESQACLCGERLDAAATAVAARELAEGQITLLNEVFAAWSDWYQPVRLTSAPVEVQPDGTRRQHYRAVTTIGGSAGGRMLEAPLRPGGVPPLSAPERMLRAAVISPHFREAMEFARGSIGDVCRAFETVKRRGNPGEDATKRGGKLIESRGWLTVDELADLNAIWEVERHGVPARLPNKGRVLALRQA
jgi:hypothetical protein